MYSVVGSCLPRTQAHFVSARALRSQKPMLVNTSRVRSRSGGDMTKRDEIASLSNTSYSDRFFDSIEDGSLSSARVVVPMVMDLFAPGSVIDFGCGRGAWLRVFHDSGVDRIHGIDGPYLDRNRLLIPEECFEPHDLSTSYSRALRYDLAICLEVAEHLPESAAAVIVKSLTRAAPVVLFSAAVPGQPGTNHINAQWPEYWRDLFRGEGFTLVDAI